MAAKNGAIKLVAGNSNPKLAEANAPLQAVLEIDPADGKNHITLTYTRRLPPTDAAYEPES